MRIAYEQLNLRVCYVEYRDTGPCLLLDVFVCVCEMEYLRRLHTRNCSNTKRENTTKTLFSLHIIAVRGR